MPLPGCLKCICPFFLISSCLGIVLLSGCVSGSAAHQEPPPPVFPPATVPLVKLSSDPFTNASSQHATEVEPDTFAFGPTIVSAFQVGRIHDGGGADIGFATSSDGAPPGAAAFCRESRCFRVAARSPPPVMLQSHTTPRMGC